MLSPLRVIAVAGGAVSRGWLDSLCIAWDLSPSLLSSSLLGPGFGAGFPVVFLRLVPEGSSNFIPCVFPGKVENCRKLQKMQPLGLGKVGVVQGRDGS